MSTAGSDELFAGGWVGGADGGATGGRAGGTMRSSCAACIGCRALADKACQMPTATAAPTSTVATNATATIVRVRCRAPDAMCTLMSRVDDGGAAIA